MLSIAVSFADQASVRVCAFSQVACSRAVVTVLNCSLLSSYEQSIATSVVRTANQEKTLDTPPAQITPMSRSRLNQLCDSFRSAFVQTSVICMIVTSQLKPGPPANDRPNVNGIQSRRYSAL